MSVKPTLSLSTPVTANFPQHPPSASELRSAISLPSAISERTPLSAVSRSSAFRDPMRSGLPSAGLPSAGPYSARLGFEELQKTPITPPVAYLDFLKGMTLVSPSIASPSQPSRALLNRTSTVSSADSNASSSKSEESTNSEESGKDKADLIESAPSTARTDVSCECEHKDPGVPKSPPAPINTKLPPTPSGSNPPLSAPAAGPDVFPSMKLPASPAVSAAGLYSPRSPLSAASIKSPFDWEAALKSRRGAETPKSAGHKRAANSETPTTPKPGPTSPTHTKRESRSSIRHIREVVTRTVTYTPRMAPAPKGKRRKLDSDAAVAS
ncbi:hypothetical protein QBC34DRAFT_295183 [Podospora aff. communis PSN243]|uniref:Uncharacterized protein n=1 Tax=Podospora aff. communis PSN243 TaxID=3040156 RepID=A0AAV9GUN4_9PEZI|nr:hypothetical protein QBC34DRAFT_295183 [Podospora aff. communis PSN243]